MRDKQAVVLIHGIGEQIPMQNLRAFVEAIWTTHPEIHERPQEPSVWSKPDQMSDSFELRRLTTTRHRGGIRTDFFELYWAHLMHGSQLSHVLLWLRALLFRWPWNVPRTLLGVWVLLMLTLALVAFFLVNELIPAAMRPVRFDPVTAGLLALAATAFTSMVVVNIVGDAARYLYAAPSNIGRRHEIRTEGVRLLEKIHASGKYRRVILVGHSLGSVIGYDILTHAWPRWNRKNHHPSPPAHAVLDELEGAASTDPLDVDGYQAIQRRYIDELHGNGCDWLVTDFVSLGSPLSHAEILLAKDRPRLERRKRERELPTCPPTPEDGIHFSYPLDDARGPGRPRLRVPHHAAVFGPTRWTNLYFPSRFIVGGDVVAGPLEPCFGAGVRDVPVHTRSRLGLLSHTLYWSGAKQGAPAPPHITALRQAVNLLDAGAPGSDAR